MGRFLSLDARGEIANDLRGGFFWWGVGGGVRLRKAKPYSEGRVQDP